MNITEKIKEHGIFGSSQKAFQLFSRLFSRKIQNAYYRWAVQDAPVYSNPTAAELEQIERDLTALGISLQDYSPASESFVKFQEAGYFPLNYHGGIDGPVWYEKLLEHWIAAERLGLMTWQPENTYVDIAACSSPWAKTLRDRFGLQAFAIDMGEVGNNYKELPYYRVENATATTFDDESITGASLQCAYEMFMNQDDVNFVKEIARILKPGGKVVILPLYMHTHYCAYATPEYYGKGYSDPNAKEYVRVDCFGVPSSRKYDAKTLKERVLDAVQSHGMHYQLLALGNKFELGKDIYCHFILEISK